MSRYRLAAIALLLGVTLGTGTAFGQAGRHHPHRQSSFLAGLAASPSLSVTTKPASGDNNPYGVAVVPPGFPAGGTIHPGDILVSNFNGSGGQQGTGTTIVDISPGGSQSLFFTAPGALAPVGLSTALVALRSGIVVVGNTPAVSGVAQNGSLIFLDSSGNVLLNLSDSALLRGPWDMTADDSSPSRPVLYVSDVLSGEVVRIDLHIANASGHPVPTIDGIRVVASGFLHRTDPNALVVGPTGLLLSPNGNRLYVADTGNDRVTAVTNPSHANGAGTGRTIVSGAPLEGPLALAWSPLGTIVLSNGDAAGPAQTPANINRVVEFDPRNGKVLDSLQLDQSGTAGAIFGITIGQVDGKESLVYVNDNSNTVNVLPRG